jgi:plasmid stabilization system protein ParE
MQVKAIHEYILEDTLSLEIADSVVNALFDSSEVLKTQSELYALDNLKLNNDGSYHAYSKYSYRISYRVIEDNVQILRVRHTSRHPFMY